MRCVIFGAAPIHDYSFYSSQMKKDDFIICADGGLRHAQNLGLSPDLILGDFDSYTQQLTDHQALHFPSEKDDTDMGLAIKYAITNGIKEICIFGGLNGRLDHTLANIHLLKLAWDQGVNAYLMDENMFVTVFEKAYTIKKNQYDYVSLIPLSEEVTGVTYQGLKYSLTEAVFEMGDPYGVSNEMAKETAEIKITSGTLILILTKEII